MKHLVAFLVFSILLLLTSSACGTARAAAPAPAPDQAHARSSLVVMAYALHASAEDCTTTARYLAKKMNEPGMTAHADELVRACAVGLIPPRDAIYFATQHADPWTPDANDEIACAGKSLAFALERIRNAIEEAGVVPSSAMDDGLAIAFEVGERAPRKCDPLHPTTSITVTVDPRIPAVEPTPPGW